jgi:hypothetical protein
VLGLEKDSYHRYCTVIYLPPSLSLSSDLILHSYLHFMNLEQP